MKLSVKPSLLAAGLLCSVAAAAAEPIRLIAHRGGVVDAKRPENSAAAVQEAIRRGYWMLETDIQESRDGHLVMQHNSFRKQYGTTKWPREMNWDEIRLLRAKEDGSRPLEFHEYAALCRGKLQLMLDTKPPNHPPAFYQSMERTLRENGLLEGAWFIGTEQSQAWFKGKARISVDREQLRKKLAAGEDTSRLYFLFEHGTTLDEEGMALAAKAGIPAVVSINEDHYRNQDRMKPAQAAIERLRGAGLQYFQIDSVYDIWLGK